MRKEEKNQLIETISEHLSNNNYIYITDISDLNAEVSSNLRRLCYKKNVKLKVVKNTLLKKAMEKTDKDFKNFYQILKGSTSIMFAEAGNIPAKLIKEFRKTSNRPILKGAYIEENIYIGDDQLDILINIKSKNELIGDIIGLLQSPVKNVMSALQSGGNKLTGILKTLSSDRQDLSEKTE
ncbi:MAG: 50S ribosomal protein L10 [Bacteroidales bacterium]|nr:50S ribosomal protein L10 [Bacteroidales bacterium]